MKRKRQYDFINLDHFLCAMHFSLSKRLHVYLVEDDGEDSIRDWICYRGTEAVDLYFACVEASQCTQYERYWRWQYDRNCPY